MTGGRGNLKLSDAKEGRVYKIVRVEATNNEFARFSSLGLVPGREVVIHGNGTVVMIEVDNSILVLDHQSASKIIVSDHHEN
ncbi:MAG: hypothetical protein B6U76_09815 [Desulfurococcales archaeon ex4484_217_2]|nr:MAG: hypothetical protein B6U76_09815 [Desulfurococcales archaeon ex4484_217_2]